MSEREINVAVVGAGCAGISAHLWLCELKIKHTLFEGKKMGGMLHRVHNTIENYPPNHYENGALLAKDLCAYVKKTVPLDVDEKGTPEEHDILVKEKVVKIEENQESFLLHLSNEKRMAFSHVLLATGTRYRQLNILGYKESAAYISQSTTFSAPSVAGKKVVMIGGGDAALEGARILWEHDCEVYLYSRSAYRARPEFVNLLSKLDRVHLMPIGIMPTSFQIMDKGLEVIFSDGSQDIFQKAFVRIGVDPILPVLFSELKKDMRGYIRTDPNCETSIPGIFAIGDVSVAPLQSIATAIGDGARAAKAIQVITQRS